MSHLILALNRTTTKKPAAVTIHVRLLLLFIKCDTHVFIRFPFVLFVPALPDFTFLVKGKYCNRSKETMIIIDRIHILTLFLVTNNINCVFLWFRYTEKYKYVTNVRPFRFHFFSFLSILFFLFSYSICLSVCMLVYAHS